MARVPRDIPLSTWIRELIRADTIWKFYKTDDWLELRDDVMRDCHFECQECLKQGIYTRAVMVHHVNEVRKRPDLALSKTFVDALGNEHKNLVALCNPCHEKEHDRFENYREQSGREKFSNVERW